MEYCILIGDYKNFSLTENPLHWETCIYIKMQKLEIKSNKILIHFNDSADYL